MQLERIEMPRPTTFDLTSKWLRAAEARILKIAANELRGRTYIATMWLETNGKIRAVDARPSDAITLVLRATAPIFVAPELIANTNALSRACV